MRFLLLTEAARWGRSSSTLELVASSVPPTAGSALSSHLRHNNNISSTSRTSAASALLRKSSKMEGRDTKTHTTQEDRRVRRRVVVGAAPVESGALFAFAPDTVEAADARALPPPARLDERSCSPPVPLPPLVQATASPPK